MTRNVSAWPECWAETVSRLRAWREKRFAMLDSWKFTMQWTGNFRHGTAEKRWKDRTNMRGSRTPVSNWSRSFSRLDWCKKREASCPNLQPLSEAVRLSSGFPGGQWLCCSGLGASAHLSSLAQFWWFKLISRLSWKSSSASEGLSWVLFIALQ